MTDYFDLSRRRFLKTTVVGGAAVLAVPLIGRQAGVPGAIAQETATATDAELFVSLMSDGTVEITCHRSEMGQHARTAVAQIVVDEMEADWTRVTIAQALGDKRYGDQNTDGSRSIRFNFERLRLVGASFRHMFAEAASQQWDVAADACRVEQHKVYHDDTGRVLDFADLAQAVSGMTPPAAPSLQLKARDAWRHIGKGNATVDMRDILTGRGTFGADVRLPDTVVASIERPPVVLSKVVSLDATEAKKVPGVIDVIEMPALTEAPWVYQPLGGVAVLATNTWAAQQARSKLKIEWAASPNDDYNSDSFREFLETGTERESDVHVERGDVDAALATAATRHSARYYAPHLTQAPMEPAAATARFVDGVMEVWATTQNPQSDQSLIAGYLGLEPSKVKVHVTLLGGAFGRKSKPDFSAEAAYLAKTTGRTVRVQWKREDDTRHGFYHGVSAQLLQAGLDESGRMAAWHHHSTASPIGATFTAGDDKLGGGKNRGLADAPFVVANMRAESGRAPGKVRIGWMRSVDNIFHVFAQQSFMGELSALAGRDHRDFLLESIGPDRIIDFEAEGSNFNNYGADFSEYPFDTARLKYVLERATANADWDRERPDGVGLGLAVHRSFLTYVATVVEVAVSEGGELSIPGVWTAVDAGTVVNTDSVRNQMQGAAVFGLSLALHSQITVKDGAVEQSNFNDYRVARISEAPAVIDVEVVSSTAPPAGVGEPGVPPFAPALCNAIYAASGKRIRELPIGDQLRA